MNPAAGLSSKTTEPVIADVRPFIRLPSSEWQTVEGRDMLTGLPDWSGLKYFVVGNSEMRYDLISLDPSDGSIRDKCPIPFALGPGAISFRPLEKGASVPGLFPIAGTDRLAMLSCTVPDQARVLWQRGCGRSEFQDSGIEFGPLGVDHFIWHFYDQLHCSHPMTGEDLWTRHLKVSGGESYFSTIHRIFGDRHATVVMGSDSSGFQRFSTRDGHLLGNGRLSIGRVSEAATSGRFLIYPDIDSRLHVFDGATGSDILDEEEPVILGRHSPDRIFSMLSDGRVVTVSSTREIVLVDTQAGRVAFRTPTKDHLDFEPVLCASAFERNGRLFVGLDDGRRNRVALADDYSRRGEPRLGFGPLFCLDPQTGGIEWSLLMEPAVIPRIYGDPTDLLVVWNLPDSTDKDRPDAPRDMLNVRLIDGTTGRVIAEESSLSTAPPFRCVHVAEENTIQIFSRDAVISFRTQAGDQDAP